jgi:hypothetical protein
MASTGSFTNAGATLALNFLFRIRNTATRPTRLYLGLAKTAGTITRASTLTNIAAFEVADANYARLALDNGSSTDYLGAPSDSGSNMQITNSAQTFTFGGAGFATGSEAVNQAFICDASSGTSGTVYFFFDLGTTKNTNIGETLVVSLNNFTIGLI